MARLPQVGGDNGNWGSLLNEFLLESHDPDGKLKDSSVSSIKLAATAGADGDMLTKASGQVGGLEWSRPTISSRRYIVADVASTNTAAQNSTAINDAIAVAATSGKEVIIPGGTFNHHGITFPAAGPVTLRGVGYGQTILRNTHTTNASITVAGTGAGVYCNLATLSDMTLTASTRRATQVGLDVLLTWKLSVANLNITQHGIGVRHKASWETLYAQVLVHECGTGWQFPDPAPYTASCPVTLVDCSAVECVTRGLDIVDAIESMSWQGGDFTGSAAGMRILGNQTRSVTFNSVNFEGMTGDDIIIGDSSTGPSSINFNGCRFFRTTTGSRSVYIRRAEAVSIVGSSFTNYSVAVRQDNTSGSVVLNNNSVSNTSSFLDLDGAVHDNLGLMTSHPTNGVSSYGGSLPRIKVGSVQGAQWVATQNLYGAGKTTVNDSDFSVPPVDGATCLVYNTDDNTIRHAIRDYGSWRVSAPYS